MAQLSVDILSLVFQYLETKKLFRVKEVHQRWRRTFQKYIGTFHFDFAESSILDSHLEYLKGARYVDLEECELVTDAGVIEISDNLHTIDLSNTKITSVCIPYLAEAHTVNLTDVRGICNEDLKHLSQVHTLELTHIGKNEYEVKPSGIAYLTGVRTLRMCDCEVTKEILVAVKKHPLMKLEYY
jgi:hypothetical protein